MSGPHPPIYREVFGIGNPPYIDLVWSSEIGGYIPRPENVVPEPIQAAVRELIAAEKRVRDAN